MVRGGLQELRTTSVSRWPVWGERKRVLALIAVVEVLAVVLPTTLWTPVSMHYLVTAVLLIGLSLVYSQIAFGWERVRRLLLFRRVPSVMPSVQATWCLAGALLLPAALAAVVTASCWAGAWRTAYNYPAGTPRRPHRYIYSTAANALAATACSWVTHGHVPAPLIAPAAGVLWMVTTGGAAALAVAAAAGLGAARSILHLRTHALVATTVVLAAGGYYAANLLAVPALALSVPAAIGVQRFFAQAELRGLDAQEAAERLRAREAQAVVDSLMTQASWIFVAEILVQEYACSLVRIEGASDLENLAKAVRAVMEVQHGNELVGRYGPTGIAVILPGGPHQAGAMALRIAGALANRGVLSCRVVSASASPRDGLTVNALLAICEAELVVRGGQSANSEHDQH